MVKQELADHRIPLTRSTWYALSNAKRPGQTFDDLVLEMLDIKDKWHAEQLEMDLAKAEKEESIPLNVAIKYLGNAP